MKKILAFVLAASITISGYSIGISSGHPVKATEVYIEIGDGKMISMQQLADMSLRDFQKFSDRKMNLADKITFRLGQKKLRENIRPDGTFINERIVQEYAYDEGSGVHGGGLALGFLLGLIGVLIAYLIKDDKRDRRRKWAWIGFGIYVVAYLAIVLTLL